MLIVLQYNEELINKHKINRNISLNVYCAGCPQRKNNIKIVQKPIRIIFCIAMYIAIILKAENKKNIYIYINI